MNTRIINFLALLFVSSFLLVSCNKDKDLDNLIDEETTEQNAVSNAYQNFNAMVTTTDTDSTICYDITFPLTFLLEDGGDVTVNSDQELEDLFETEPDIVDFVYPVNLIDPETGETIVANNEDELIQYFEACFDEDEWEEDDEWEDDDDVYCDSIDVGTLACYELVFPVSFVLEDGTTVTAQTESDIDGIIFSEDNPPVDFVYPLNLINTEDGSSHTANNEDELEELFEECDDFWEEDDEWDDEFEIDSSLVYLMTCISIDLDLPPADSLGFSPCYAYVYPISLITDDNTTLTANSDEEMMELIFTNPSIEDFVYPFSVTDLSTGNVINVDEEEDVEELIEDCLP